MHRQAFLVLGMHRGGTSALSGALVRLGVSPPRTLMPANASNESGYWESVSLCQYHERLLCTRGSSWDAWTPLDTSDAWAPSRTLALELRGLVADEFGSSLRFVVKDPRICRFVPFWHRCLSEDGIEMRSVIIVRDPYEVASSLRARDGIGTEIALLLWLRHLLDAELSTRQMRRSIVSYPHLLCDAPRVLDRIGRDLETDWPVAPGIAAADLKTFLRPELRHHSRAPSTTGGAAPVASWVEQVVAAFDDLASMERSHDGTALRTLDAVKQDLDRAAAAFGIPDELIRDADRVSLTDARPDLDELRSQVAALSADRERIDRHARVLEAERANVHEQLTLMHAECERLRAHLCGVLASGSWRVTAPLRLALRTARALSAVGQRRHVRPTG